MKTIQTQIPEGYEIDKDKSTFELIVLKKIKTALPMSWEELGEVKGYFVGYLSTIAKYTGNSEAEKNIFPTKELAEASLALAQLLQLRDRWNDGWVADWNNTTTKFTIASDAYIIFPYIASTVSRAMNFKTKELRDLFLDTFKDLLNIAKPLL